MFCRFLLLPQTYLTSREAVLTWLLLMHFGSLIHSLPPVEPTEYAAQAKHHQLISVEHNIFVTMHIHIRGEC